MKRHLLFAMLCIVGALNLSAQIRETDMTSQFQNLTKWENWTGATGYTATNFCPMVEVGGGIGQKQVCEKYQGTCESTGDVFYATVTGLTAGTYKIELYGGAAYTFGRGFASTAFGEGTWTAGDKIDPPGTGVTLYAEAEGSTYGGEIPIYYATEFPDGAATVTLDGVVVGSSGSIKIGMTKESTSTNWHVIQLKSVIAQVDLADLVTAKKAELQALVDQGNAVSPATAELTAALATAQGYLDTDVSGDADAADALIANMETSIAELPALIATAQNAASVAGASATNPIKTNFVVNGTFDTAGNTAPWKATGGFQNQNTATNQQGAFTVPFFENWNPSAKLNKMYQVIENIPNGVYELDICAFVNNFAGDGQESQYVFANDAKTYLTTGTPTAYKVFVEVTDNKIEVGLEQIEAIANWMGIDNVSLTYYGNCTIEEAQFGSYIASVKELKDKIRAITALPPKYLEYINSILAVIYDTYSTVEEYEYAISTLNDLYDQSKEIEELYAQYTNMHNYVTALLAVPYVENVAGAHAALEAANVEPVMQYKQDLYNAIYDLNHAAWEYARDADPDAGAQFDLTFFLTNPDVTKFWDGTWGIQPEGWLSDQNPVDNFQVMQNNDMGPGGEVFMEYWSGTAKTSEFVLYQQVNLPAGTYKMTGRVGLLQSDDGKTPNPNMTFSANDTDGSQIAVGPLADQSVEFVNPTEDVVKIGIKPHEGNTYHWIGINNIHLYKVPAQSFFIECMPVYDYDETGAPIETWANYDSKTSGAGDVTLHRDFISGDYNTIVLPFNMNAEEVQEVFGEGTEVFLATSYNQEADNISLTTPAEGFVIQANVPCVIKPTEYREEGLWFIPERTLVPTDVDNPAFVGDKVTMIGNYQGNFQLLPSYSRLIFGYSPEQIPGDATGWDDNNEYVPQVKIYWVDEQGQVYLHPTTCYFEIERGVSPLGEIKQTTFTVNGQATGIATVENGEVKFFSGKIFDLSGREVKNPGRGIYIVGGKKVMIK